MKFISTFFWIHSSRDERFSFLFYPITNQITFYPDVNVPQFRSPSIPMIIIPSQNSTSLFSPQKPASKVWCESPLHFFAAHKATWQRMERQAYSSSREYERGSLNWPVRFAAKQRSARVRTRIFPMHVIQEREREVSQNKCVRKKFHLLICVRRGCARELCECARGEESRKNICTSCALLYIFYIFWHAHTYIFSSRGGLCTVCGARVRIKINIGIKM